MYRRRDYHVSRLLNDRVLSPFSGVVKSSAQANTHTHTQIQQSRERSAELRERWHRCDRRFRFLLDRVEQQAEVGLTNRNTHPMLLVKLPWYRLSSSSPSVSNIAAPTVHCWRIAASSICPIHFALALFSLDVLGRLPICRFLNYMPALCTLPRLPVYILARPVDPFQCTTTKMLR